MNPKRKSAAAVLASLGKALCYLFLFLISQTVVTMLYLFAATFYFFVSPAALDPMVAATELVMGCSDQISLVSGLATLIVLAAFFLLRRKAPLGEVGIHRCRARSITGAAALTPLLYTAVMLVFAVLPASWMESYAEASAHLDQTGLLTILATVVIAPVVEEVIFRGLVLSRLCRAMPGWLAVLLSALVFGLCHGQAVWMAYAFVLGVVFGFMTLCAKSIWPSLLAHFLFNAIGQVSVYLPETDAAAALFLGVLVAAGAVGCLVWAIVMLCRRNRKLPRGN